MYGIPFAVEAFAVGLGALDWLIFHGHYTSMVFNWL